MVEFLNMKRILYYFFWLLVFCFILSILLVGLNRVFVLFSPPRVISVYPEPGSQNISLNSSLIINFDKPIKRQEIQLSISPEVYGEISFKDSLIKNHLFRTLVFTPAIDFEPATQYQVKIENIKGFGFQKNSSFSFSFKTEPALLENKIQKEKPEPEITMIDISMDWQDHSLSCEAASLKMALAGKGIFISETEIMEKISYDMTPHRGNIWGDPYQKYVGDIDGKICRTGFGVFWEPLAKAAQSWRETEAFSEWTIDDLTREIEAGNPVIIWGVLPTGILTDCSWYTPGGKYILAFKETHVRLAIGFIGPQNNPSKIIINDPLAGRLYWSTTYFLENWKVFNNSGVVTR